MLEIIKNKNGEINTVCMWHVIDGKWRHIAQTFDKDGKVLMYTDGSLQEMPPHHKLNPC